MKRKVYFSLIALNCFFTLINQIIYHYEPSSDSLLYLQLAEQYSELNFFDPNLNCYGHSLYALFLALIGGLFSYHHYFIGLVQSLLFGFSAVLLIGELEKLLKANLLGLVIVLFLVPEIHIFNGHILTESLTISLILLAFYVGLKIYRQGTNVRRMLLLSLLVGITMLNRFESALILLPITYLILPRIKRQFIQHLLLIASIPFLLLQVNALKNYKTFNVYKLTTFNAGEAIYGGNNQNLDGSHHAFDEHKEIFIPKDRIEAFNEISALPLAIAYPKRDAFFLQLAVEAWQKDPLSQLKVIPTKLGKNWLIPGNFDIYTADTTKTRGLQLNKLLSKAHFNNVWYAPYKHLVYLLIHWSLLSLILVGIYQQDRSNRFQKSVLILFLIYCLFAIPFCGLPRWHVTIFPLLIVAFMPKVIVHKINKMLKASNDNPPYF